MHASEPTLLPVYRVTVFVPPYALEALIDGVCAVDDLRVGRDADDGDHTDRYDRALWISAPGREQFRPLPGSDPADGRTCAVARGDTVRIEFCVDRDAARLQRVIDDGIRPHHPWEVPAIFVDETLLPLPPRRGAGS